MTDNMTDKAPPITRRQFLTATVMAGLSVTLPGSSQGYKERPSEPDSMPKDLLTTEELKGIHIYIHHSPNMDIHLRREALTSFPLFKDLQSGKIKRLDIILADTDGLSWKDSETFSPPAKEIYQTFMQDPTAPVNALYDEKTIQLRQEIKESQNQLDLLTLKISPEATQAATLEIQKLKAECTEGLAQSTQSQDSYMKSFFKSGLEDIDNPKYLQREIDVQLWKNSQYAQLRREYEGLVKKFATLDEERNQAIKDALEYDEYIGSGVAGRYLGMNPFDEPSDSIYAVYQKALLKKHPELEDRVVIVLALGAKMKSFEKSFPQPDNFQIDQSCLTQESPSCYSISFNALSPSHIVRHEISHYETGQERNADLKAFVSISEAWKKYQSTGDTSGYPFVFVEKGTGKIYIGDKNSDHETTGNA